MRYLTNRAIAVAVCLMLLCGCAQKILELQDVQNFKLTEREKQSQIDLEISGLCYHSALAVNHITVKTNASDLIVIVKLARAYGQMSGSFDYHLSVPNQINRVLFGKEEKVIWTRQSRLNSTNGIPIKA